MNNTVFANTFSKNTQTAIGVSFCSHNSILANSIAQNPTGIELYHAYNNSIMANTLQDNGNGTYLTMSHNNTFYHNNWINNAGNAVNDGSQNTWDNGYPSGGNYWSDHNPTDKNKDKIGDTPYAIDQNNTDKYPLIYPYEFYLPEYAPEPDVNNDGIVNIIDIATVAKAFWSMPGDARWNPLAEMDMNETINILDISKVAKEFGKKTHDGTTE
jgi:parallel beta-helix repeat protein